MPVKRSIKNSQFKAFLRLWMECIGDDGPSRWTVKEWERAKADVRANFKKIEAMLITYHSLEASAVEKMVKEQEWRRAEIGRGYEEWLEQWLFKDIREVEQLFSYSFKSGAEPTDRMFQQLLRERMPHRALDPDELGKRTKLLRQAWAEALKEFRFRVDKDKPRPKSVTGPRAEIVRSLMASKRDFRDRAKIHKLFAALKKEEIPLPKIRKKMLLDRTDDWTKLYGKEGSTHYNRAIQVLKRDLHPR